MSEENEPLTRIHDPILAKDNPVTPITYQEGAREENLNEIINKDGEGVLPEIKVGTPKSS